MILLFSRALLSLTLFLSFSEGFAAFKKLSSFNRHIYIKPDSITPVDDFSRKVIRAIITRDLDRLEKLYAEEGRSINTRLTKGRGLTGVMISVLFERRSSFEFFIRKKADLRLIDSVGLTAPMMAAYKGLSGFMNTMISKVRLLDHVDELSRNLLALTIVGAKNHSAGKNESFMGNTLLQGEAAAQRGFPKDHMRILELFTLELKENPRFHMGNLEQFFNFKDINGRTPLDYSQFYFKLGDSHFAEFNDFLTKNGAELSGNLGQGFRKWGARRVPEAISMESLKSHYDIKSLKKSHFIDPLSFEIAEAIINDDVVELEKRYRGFVSSQEYLWYTTRLTNKPSGFNGLMLAVLSGSDKALDFLLNKKVDVWIQDHRGMSAPAMAVLLGRMDMLKRMVLKIDRFRHRPPTYSVDRIRDANGRGGIFLAMIGRYIFGNKGSYFSIMKFILKHSRKEASELLNLQDKKGLRPIDYAESFRLWSWVTFFLENGTSLRGNDLNSRPLPLGNNGLLFSHLEKRGPETKAEGNLGVFLDYLARGADSTVKNERGEGLLEVALNRANLKDGFQIPRVDMEFFLSLYLLAHHKKQKEDLLRFESRMKEMGRESVVKAFQKLKGRPEFDLEMLRENPFEFRRVVSDTVKRLRRAR